MIKVSRIILIGLILLSLTGCAPLLTKDQLIETTVPTVLTLESNVPNAYRIVLNECTLAYNKDSHAFTVDGQLYPDINTGEITILYTGLENRKTQSLFLIETVAKDKSRLTMYDSHYDFNNMLDNAVYGICSKIGCANEGD